MTNNPPFTSENTSEIQSLFALALAEDRVGADATSHAMFAADERMTAKLVARERMVFAGAEVVEMLLQMPTPLPPSPRLRGTGAGGDLMLDLHVQDGAILAQNAVIGKLSGPTIQLLSFERTLLNVLQRLCGVATLTRQYVDAVAGTGAVILDTRKTLPGWRVLDKYAVRCGGGQNHRMHLADAMMLKDNHIAAAGSMEAAIEKALAYCLPRRRGGRECAALEGGASQEGEPVGERAISTHPQGLQGTSVAPSVRQQASAGANNVSHPPLDCSAISPPPLAGEAEGVSIIVECDTLEQVKVAMGFAVDRLLLDNMSLEDLRQAVKLVDGRMPLEASGGVNLKTVRGIAETGVDYISVGAVTHSAVAVDIGLD